MRNMGSDTYYRIRDGKNATIVKSTVGLSDNTGSVVRFDAIWVLNIVDTVSISLPLET